MVILRYGGRNKLLARSRVKIVGLAADVLLCTILLLDVRYRIIRLHILPRKETRWQDPLFEEYNRASSYHHQTLPIIRTSTA